MSSFDEMREQGVPEYTRPLDSRLVHGRVHHGHCLPLLAELPQRLVSVLSWRFFF
jgi:hypothetical protein